jgi:hypothetical protein
MCDFFRFFKILLIYVHIMCTEYPCVIKMEYRVLGDIVVIRFSLLFMYRVWFRILPTLLY